MNLTLLGNKVEGWKSPHDAILETIPNNQSHRYSVRMTCPEFTSRCPITGQPDFACIVIDYIPNQFLVESKALKLFMVSFREHPDFHEACTNYIAMRLLVALDPTWLRVAAFWYPRGGIPLDVFWQNKEPPPGVYVHPLDIPAYRGR